MVDAAILAAAVCCTPWVPSGGVFGGGAPLKSAVRFVLEYGIEDLRS